jgi:hypothetical protein
MFSVIRDFAISELEIEVCFFLSSEKILKLESIFSLKIFKYGVNLTSN